MCTRSCIFALLSEFEEAEDNLLGTYSDECKETDEHKSELFDEQQICPQEPEDYHSIMGCSVIGLWDEDLLQESENKWQLFSFLEQDPSDFCFE